MKYRVEQYRNQIANSDQQTKKRFEMIRRLSKDFTIENETAGQLDELLAEQMELESSEPSPSSTRTKAPSTGQKSKKGTGLQELEETFNELFEELKKRQPAGPINHGEITDMIASVLSESKIGWSQLDEAVQQKLNSTTQVIRYDIPNAPTRAFEKPPIGMFQSMVDDLMLGHNLFLVGGAGTGKTYLAEQLLAKLALGRKHITINCSQWTSPTEIIGGQTMDGYVEGKLIEAWENGYVLILDELPKIDPNTAGLFNDALAKTKIPGAVIFNSKKESFVKHKDFSCIATGNIYPDKESIAYGANNKQDLSLLDRFSGSVYFIEKNPEIETQIVQNDMIWSVCNKMRSVIEDLKYEAQLSLRFMQNARDSFLLEMKRYKEKSKNVPVNDGKTFKTAVDSYLSPFTEIQQKNIREQIKYKEIFSNYQYRDINQSKRLF